MNPINLIFSTLALGTMIGVSGSHFQQVKAMVGNASQMPIASLASSVDSAPVFEVKPNIRHLPMTSVSRSPQPALVKKIPSSQTSKVSLDQRDSALMEILVAIRNEQKNMRAQLGDTNRNVDELAFRVDTYSTQFRPLQTEITTPRALVVPDDEFAAPMGAANQLLPPKQ